MKDLIVALVDELLGFHFCELALLSDVYMEEAAVPETTSEENVSMVVHPVPFSRPSPLILPLQRHL